MTETHETMSRFLGDKADRPASFLGSPRATRIMRRPEGAIALKYQSTDVVTWYPDGRVKLDSGKWRTVTTKARMNQVGINVYQTKSVWYLDGALFEDEMILGADGKPENPIDPEINAKISRKLSRMISTYINGYVAHVMENGPEQPSSGDCWGCCMRPVTNPESTLEVMGHDHYLSHFREEYYVPTILVRATDEFGSSPEWSANYRGMIATPGLRSEYIIKRPLVQYFRTRRQSILEALELEVTA